MKSLKYLSWSRMDLWERSPKEYVKTYILGEGFDSPYMELGRRFADAREHAKPTGDFAIDHLCNLLPKFPQREIYIKAKLEGIPLIGKFDGVNISKRIFCDDKTATKYSQSKADNLGQITFYYTILWKKYGWLPNYALVNWAETKRVGREIKLTGNFEVFKTQRHMKDIMLMYRRMKRAWAGIQELHKNQ